MRYDLSQQQQSHIIFAVAIVCVKLILFIWSALFSNVFLCSKKCLIVLKISHKKKWKHLFLFGEAIFDASESAFENWPIIDGILSLFWNALFLVAFWDDTNTCGSKESRSRIGLANNRYRNEYLLDRQDTPHAFMRMRIIAKIHVAPLLLLFPTFEKILLCMVTTYDSWKPRAKFRHM